MHNACRKCASRCCKYFCVAIRPPRDAEDFEEVRWCLVHRGVSVHVDLDGDWWLLVKSRCRWLKRDGLCRNYARRPLICRQFSPQTCDFSRGAPHVSEWFDTPDELERYAAQMLGKRQPAMRARTAGAKAQQRHGATRKRAR